MSKVKDFIESGILELYVLGLASEAECKEVELMCSLYEEIGNELETISQSLVSYAAQNAPTARSTVKPLLMATIDYTERINHGEPESFPPILNETSSIDDYTEWLSRPDMVAPETYNDIFIKLIASNHQAVSAIVWIKNETPMETHAVEHEKFLIVEGSCDIFINDVPHSMKPGDYMSIPLHAAHIVKVTSPIACKVVLQRVAA
jgi:mannose-6-phosphate isomerase-like protein (cupin superfamily)